MTIFLWQTAHPYLLLDSRDHGETFNLAILDGTDILYINRIKTQKILTINLEIGSKLPAYCTSMGRVLLAFLPEEQALKIIEQSSKMPMSSHQNTEEWIKLNYILNLPF